MRLVLMRGLPGSGKSHLAKQLAGDEGVVLSTDDFFMSGGVYKFDPTKLGAHHGANQRRAEESMAMGVSPIVIDNTNVRLWEMRAYAQAAIAHGYEIEFAAPTTEWAWNPAECAKRNAHGVPLAAIERMAQAFEPDATVEKVLASFPAFSA